MIKEEQVTGIPGTGAYIADTSGFFKNLVWSTMGIIWVCHICHKLARLHGMGVMVGVNAGALVGTGVLGRMLEKVRLVGGTPPVKE